MLFSKRSEKPNLESVILSRVASITGNSFPFTYDLNKLIELPLPFLFRYYNDSRFELNFAQHKEVTINDEIDLAIVDCLDCLGYLKALSHTKVYAILQSGNLGKYLKQASMQGYFWSDFYSERGEYHLILFKKRTFGTFPWNGKQTSGHLFVYSEWGWGDIIRNLRYLKPLSKIFQLVTFEARSEIASLASLYPVSVIPKGSPIPNHNFHIRIEEVHKYIPAFYERIPLPLTPGFDKIFNVGIVWKGSCLTENAQRDFKIDFLKKIKSSRINLWSFCTKTPTHLKPAIQDYNSWEKTAKMLSNMDLVISADTAIAHLAGSLGLKTIVLLPKKTYLTPITHDTQIWYPSISILRSTLDDWTDAYDNVSQKIKDLARLKIGAM